MIKNVKIVIILAFKSNFYQESFFDFVWHEGDIVPFFNYTCYLYQHKIKTFGNFTAH